MSIDLLLLCPSGSSTAKVIFVQGGLAGRPMPTGYADVAFMVISSHQLLGITITADLLGGASYMVLIL
jgi:hypothetical protein